MRFATQSTNIRRGRIIETLFVVLALMCLPVLIFGNWFVSSYGSGRTLANATVSGGSAASEYDDTRAAQDDAPADSDVATTESMGSPSGDEDSDMAGSSTRGYGSPLSGNSEPDDETYPDPGSDIVDSGADPSVEDPLGDLSVDSTPSAHSVVVADPPMDPAPVGDVAAVDPLATDPLASTDPLATDPLASTDPLATDPLASTDPLATDPLASTDPVGTEPVDLLADPVAAVTEPAGDATESAPDLGLSLDSLLSDPAPEDLAAPVVDESPVTSDLIVTEPVEPVQPEAKQVPDAYQPRIWTRKDGQIARAVFVRAEEVTKDGVSSLIVWLASPSDAKRVFKMPLSYLSQDDVQYVQNQRKPNQGR